MILQIPDYLLTEHMLENIQRTIERAPLARYMDVRLRIDGCDETHEADWLKHLVVRDDYDEDEDDDPLLDRTAYSISENEAGLYVVEHEELDRDMFFKTRLDSERYIKRFMDLQEVVGRSLIGQVDKPVDGRAVDCVGTEPKDAGP